MLSLATGIDGLSAVSAERLLATSERFAFPVEDAVDSPRDGPTVSWHDDRLAYGEHRINLLGWLHGTVVHMTYTERGDEPHIIRLRKAEKHEVRHYIKEISR